MTDRLIEPTDVYSVQVYLHVPALSKEDAVERVDQLLEEGAATITQGGVSTPFLYLNLPDGPSEVHGPHYSLVDVGDDETRQLIHNAAEALAALRRRVTTIGPDGHLLTKRTEQLVGTISQAEDDLAPVVNAVTIYANPGDVSEPADSWFWSSGDRWVAVVATYHDDWWDGADPADIAARPDPWKLPLDQRPTYGTLHWRDADGNEHTESARPEGA